MKRVPESIRQTNQGLSQIVAPLKDTRQGCFARLNLSGVPMALSKFERLEAIPTHRIICGETDTLVGIAYRWNAGEVAVMWRGEPRTDVLWFPINGLGPAGPKLHIWAF